jgi:hypothetical protein
VKLGSDYLEEIRKRRKESKVYREFQLVGLEIADMLGDRAHKSLYIRLAKGGNKSLLLSVAKDVSERRGIKNKGAYFMRVWQKEKLPKIKK